MKYHIPKMAQMAGSDVKIMLIRDVNSVRECQGDVPFDTFALQGVKRYVPLTLPENRPH